MLTAGHDKPGSVVMGTRIYHHPRVAWDFAQIVVDMATVGDEMYIWFSTRVAELMGTRYRRDLHETRTRLASPTRDDARHVEAGLWRARIDDLLRDHTDLAEDLYILTHDASSRLARRQTSSA
jgi:hypothetical protein